GCRAYQYTYPTFRSRRSMLLHALLADRMHLIARLLAGIASMLPRTLFLAVSFLAGFAAVGLTLAAEPDKTTTDLRFEVTVAKNLVKEARDGRLLIVLGRDDGSEPRKSIGDTGLKAAPLLGVDVKALTASSKIVVDQ